MVLGWPNGGRAISVAMGFSHCVSHRVQITFVRRAAKRERPARRQTWRSPQGGGREEVRESRKARRVMARRSAAARFIGRQIAADDRKSMPPHPPTPAPPPRARPPHGTRGDEPPPRAHRLGRWSRHGCQRPSGPASRGCCRQKWQRGAAQDRVWRRACNVACSSALHQTCALPTGSGGLRAGAQFQIHWARGWRLRDRLLGEAHSSCATQSSRSDCRAQLALSPQVARF